MGGLVNLDPGGAEELRLCQGNSGSGSSWLSLELLPTASQRGGSCSISCCTVRDDFCNGCMLKIFLCLQKKNKKKCYSHSVNLSSWTVSSKRNFSESVILISESHVSGECGESETTGFLWHLHANSLVAKLAASCETSLTLLQVWEASRVNCFVVCVCINNIE